MKEQHPAKGEKLVLACPTCDKRFIQKAGLNLHIAEQHSAEKPRFGCPQCGKVYARAATLTKHTKDKHSAEKPPQLRESSTGVVAPTGELLSVSEKRQKRRATEDAEKAPWVQAPSTPLSRTVVFELTKNPTRMENAPEGPEMQQLPALLPCVECTQTQSNCDGARPRCGNCVQNGLVCSSMDE